MEKATLRLFNAIQVNSKDNREIPRAVLERTVRHGYVLDPAIKPEDSLLDSIEVIVGLSGEKANASFHKSWSIVQDASMETLVLQQIVHYLTTYGFEQLGIYREDAVYIPRETLELPAIEEDIPLVVIRAMDAQEILAAIVKLGSGIALAQPTLDDIMSIIEANKYDSGFVENIGNRELKALLYDFYGLVPSDPVEFLRHLVSKLTDESLLIKNDRLIEKIKQANGKFLDALLKDAPDDLASIFFRFKPLFLAMKSISRNKNFFNQLRKKADKLHVPMPEDYLNSVTVQVKRGMLDLDILSKRLEKASIFRKIRLAYALKHRLHASNSIVYKVRNGRGWAAEFDWPEVLQSLTQDALDTVVLSIADDMSRNVNGKTIYIPENVHYALPATEKQFTGNLPNGTSVSVPNDLVVGIHWTNTNKRVDLDLSVIGESGKIGWDADYRSKAKDVLFSGDMTDARAPKGASELFYLREGQGEARILMVNYFNYTEGDEVEAKILAAHEHPGRFGMNYMVDVNNIIASANINITRKQNILGLITPVKGQNRVYFSNVSVGNSITSYGSEQSAHARIYLVESLVNSLSFREILAMAGAIVVDEKVGKIDVDLSPEHLNKSTIINLIKPGT